MSVTEAEHSPTRRPLWRNPNTWFVAEALVGLTLALILLDAKSFTSDEGTTALWTGDTWGFLLTGIGHIDANMIGYDIFQKLWRVLGDSDTMLRIPSALAVAGSIFVVAKLAHRLFDARTAVVAGAIFATGRLLIEHGQNARSYSLLVLFTALATYAFVDSVERGGRRRWIVFTVLTVVAIYMHLFAVLVLAAQVVSLAFSRRNIRNLRSLWISIAVAGLFCLPIAAAILATGGDQIDWIGKPTLSVIRITLLGLGSGSLRSVALLACFVGAALAFVRLFRSEGRGPTVWRSALLWCWLLLPPIIVLAASLTVKQVWLTRYFVILLAPIAILAAYGITRIADWRVVAGATAAVVLLGVPTLVDWYRHDTEDFRSATAAVLAGTKPGDGVVFCGDWIRRPFEYYADQQGGDRPDPVSPPDPWGHGSNLSLLDGDAEVRAALEEHPRIWVVRWRALTSQAESPLCAGIPGKTLSNQDFTGVKVRLVEPRT